MPGAERLAALALQPHDGRQQLLRRDEAVPCLGCFQARVAVAAGAGCLAEVVEQVLAAASDRLAECQHRVEMLPETGLEGAVAGRLVDHAALLHDVAESVGHPGDGCLAVAARAAGLLVVPLDGLRQVDVGDEPDVGLVDAHAERDRRDHDDAVLAEESGLVRGARLGRKARVVRQRVDPLGGEELRRLLDRLAAQRVDDAGRPYALRPDEGDELAARVGLRLDAVLDVRPVEARHEMQRVRQLQPLGHLAVGRGSRGGGEREARHTGEPLGERAQREIVGPEVVAPLRHAVRLVDRDDTELSARQEPQRGLGVQPLGRHVQQVELAGEVGALDGGALGRCLSGVEVGGAHAVGDERVDLVVHQGDERAHDESGARTHQGRHLVADALAAAGGHEHDGVAAGDDLIDDRGLLAAERVEPVDLAQHGAGVGPGEVAPRTRPGERVEVGRAAGTEVRRRLPAVLRGRPRVVRRGRVAELGRQEVGLPREVGVRVALRDGHPSQRSRGIRRRPCRERPLERRTRGVPADGALGEEPLARPASSIEEPTGAMTDRSAILDRGTEPGCGTTRRGPIRISAQLLS